MRFTACLLILVALALVADASVPKGKIYRVGKSLLKDGKPFRLVGLNLWPAAIASWNQPVNGHAILNDGDELAQWLATIRKSAPHVNVIRTWFFQTFAIKNGQRDFTALDKVLSVCASYGFRVIPVLEDHWDFERRGSSKTYLDKTWYSGGYKSTVLPKEIKPYRTWVKEVVKRYAGNKIIAVWEIMNEPWPTEITLGFVKDISGLVKYYDHYTPVGLGESVGPFDKSFYTLPSVDLLSYHYYDRYHQTHWNDVNTMAKAVGKPWYMGEAGYEYRIWSDSTHSYTYPSLTTRANNFKSLISQVFHSSNCVGFLAWQFQINNDHGDDFNINAGDLSLKVIDSFVPR